MDKRQAYNDGNVKIYSVGNVAPPGDMPRDGLIYKLDLHYDMRTVGINRFWAAKQNQIEIGQVIRAPRISYVTTQDIAIPNDGNQYKIVQIQYPEDVMPKSMDLSLERLAVDYEIAGS
jgi:hypothetical protein